MFALPPDLGHTRPLRVVALGAHADDVEIGAGGTLLRLLAERPDTHVTAVVATGDTARQREARDAAADLLRGAASATVLTPGFRDGFLPHEQPALKDWARERLTGTRPHLVLTHRRDDAHQDHRALGDLAWQTFRGATIAEMEIPKWDGDLGQPNAYVALSEAQVERKLDLLGRHFGSQRGKGWYDDETFRGLARLRGVEAGTRYAEAFRCTKLVWT